MIKKLNRNFYTRPTLEVAKSLLGKYIIRKIACPHYYARSQRCSVFGRAKRCRRGTEELVGKIIETEAYIGPQDKASHAFGGKRTPRNQAEFLIGGHIYIYLVYGMYWQINISTAKEEEPECVLIRAIEPEKDKISLPSTTFQRKSSGKGDTRKVVLGLTNGPGKLCRYLKLNKSFYGEDVTKSKRIWLEDRAFKPKKILATKRIGIDYAGPYWAKRKWRFLIK